MLGAAAGLAAQPDFLVYWLNPCAIPLMTNNEAKDQIKSYYDEKRNTFCSQILKIMIVIKIPSFKKTLAHIFNTRNLISYILYV